jgi:hypothetical protein
MESFEAALIALGEAPYNVFDHKNIGGSGVLKLRADARKFMMMLTDEDADGPIYPANWDWGLASSWSSYDSGKYAEDLKETIRVLALAARDVTLYMFTNPNSGVSRRQFGDPACDRSNADFSNFQRQGDDRLPGGRRPVAVARLRPLSRGKLARNFDVEDIARPGFVQNFFIDAVRNVAKCQLRKKRQAADRTACIQVLVDARLLHRVHVRHRL